MKANLTSAATSIEPFLLFIGVAILPVYVFSSGGVQPAHMVLAIFGFISLFKRGVPASVWVLFLAGISVYSMVVESFYVMLGAPSSSLINSLFFVYNFILVTATYSYCRQSGVSVLAPGLLCASAIALVAILWAGVSTQVDDQARATAAFNNPNQLGYFSVCILSLTYLMYRHGLLKYIVAVGLFAVAIFLSVASLSKAAMVSNFVVAFLALKPVKHKSVAVSWGLSAAGIAWFVLALSALVAILFLYVQGVFDHFLFVERLQGIMSEDDSSLAARGYFAFLEGNSFQVLLGLGSSGVLQIAGHEVHSTLASVFNNYGILGFTIFISTLLLWVFHLWRAYGFVGMCCLTGPAMLYGITHNGIRFTAFWILFGASMAMASRLIRNRKPSISAV